MLENTWQMHICVDMFDRKIVLTGFLYVALATNFIGKFENHTCVLP